MTIRSPRRPSSNEYQEMLEGGCPWCGEPLQVKTGKFGEFIACAEWCGYKKSVIGRSEYPPPKQPAKCSFDKCDGSGLIPFTKAGTIIPHTFTHCDCHREYGVNARERYIRYKVSDFDFPMSETFRGFSFEQSGEFDPLPLPEQAIGEPEPEEWEYRQWQAVQQLRAEIQYVRNQLAEKQEDKKRMSDPF